MKVFSMKKAAVIVITFFYFLGYSSMHPIIDGTITPSYVQNTYNFSNNESAKGFVSFLKGFNLPAGGTVTLNLAPGCMVNGPINLNGGTLKIVNGSPIFFGPDTTKIIGNGTIDANHLIITKELIFTGTVNFTASNLTLSGRGNIRFIIKPTALLDFSQSSGTLNIKNLQFIGFERTITGSTKPATLSLANADLVFTSPANYTLGANILSVGTSSVSTGAQGTLFCAQTIRNNGGQLTIKPLSTIKTSNIILPTRASELILDNAALDFYNANSLNAAVQVGNLTSSGIGGLMTVKGRSRMGSTGNLTVTFPKSVELLIFTKSRLELEEGFHIVFQ